jgi:hypothetical protein
MSKGFDQSGDPPKAATTTGDIPATPRGRRVEEVRPNGDKLTVMKQSAQEVHARWKMDERKQQERQLALAEAYKQRKKELAEQSREERHRRLARLKTAPHVNSCSSLAMSSELAIDEEYRSLLEKYGNKLKVPPLPLSHTTSVVTHATTSVLSQESSAHTISSPTSSRPPVPRFRKPQAKVDDKVILNTVGSSPTKSGRPHLPAITGPTPPSGQAGPSPPASEALRSLMPRKELLRKQQQQLLKSTDVVFYKKQMKAHLNRILAAVELTFDGTAPKRWKAATQNLANPEATLDTRNLSSVVAI